MLYRLRRRTSRAPFDTPRPGWHPV